MKPGPYERVGGASAYQSLRRPRIRLWALPRSSGRSGFQSRRAAPFRLHIPKKRPRRSIRLFRSVQSGECSATGAMRRVGNSRTPDSPRTRTIPSSEHPGLLQARRQPNRKKREQELDTRRPGIHRQIPMRALPGRPVVRKKAALRRHQSSQRRETPPGKAKTGPGKGRSSPGTVRLKPGTVLKLSICSEKE
jgi:hypothetical protein